MEFDRNLLLQALQDAADKILQRDLPVTVEAIYVFGSVLRGIPLIRDLDVVLIYSMTEDQVKAWNRFVDAMHAEGHAFLGKLRTSLKSQSIIRGSPVMPLREVLKLDSTAKSLKSIGIPPDWLGDLSWAKVLRKKLFLDFRERVISILFLGNPAMEVSLGTEEQLNEGNVPHLPFHQNKMALAWSPRDPDVKQNIDERPFEEKYAFMWNELMDFLVDINQRRVQVGGESASKTLGWRGGEHYEDLVAMCNRARQVLRDLKAI